MGRRRGAATTRLLWWAVPMADALGVKAFSDLVYSPSRTRADMVVALILFVTAPMTNALLVAAILAARRGRAPGLAGFLVGGLAGVATVAVATAAAPGWAVDHLDGLRRSAPWVLDDPSLAAQAMRSLAWLLGPQLGPALVGLAVARRWRFRFVVERRSPPPAVEATRALP